MILNRFSWWGILTGLFVLILSVILFFSPFSLFHSDENYASLSKIELHKKLKAVSQSSEKVDILLAIQQKESISGNMPEVIRLSREIRQIAGPTGDSLAIAKSLQPIRGNIDFKDQKEIKPFFPGAIAVLKRQKSYFNAARLSASYGVILLHEGNAEQAQKYLLYAMKTLEDVDSLRKGVNVALNLSSSYALLGSQKQSNFYMDYAITLARKYSDSSGLASSLMNRGTYFTDIAKNHKRAIVDFQEAASVIPEGDDYLRLMNDYNLALAFMHIGDLKRANVMLMDLYKQFTLLKADEGIAMVDKGLAELAQIQKDFQKSKGYLLHAIKLFDQLGIDIESFNARKQLRDTYLKLGEFAAASNLSMELEVRNEKMFSAEKAKSFADMSEKYAAEKREIQIIQLRRESNYQKIGLCLLCILVTAFYFSFRYQRRIVREKRLSYSVLMKQYRAEQLVKSTSQSSTVQVSGDAELFLQLCDYYEKEKPYLDSKLKANTVASKLRVRSRDISSLLKSKGYNGFNEFTNRFRIEEVKARLADPAMAHLKIESIALDAGFGSKQSFYAVFEEFTGLNPAFYREEITKA